jgi:hypothetical protein
MFSNSSTSRFPNNSSAYFLQSDFDEHVTRRINLASLAVTTLAGVAGSAGSTDGVGTAAKLNQPNAVAMNIAGSIAFVVSTLHMCIFGSSGCDLLA